MTDARIATVSMLVEDEGRRGPDGAPQHRWMSVADGVEVGRHRLERELSVWLTEETLERALSDRPELMPGEYKLEVPGEPSVQAHYPLVTPLVRSAA